MDIRSFFNKPPNGGGKKSRSGNSSTNKPTTVIKNKEEKDPSSMGKGEDDADVDMKKEVPTKKRNTGSSGDSDGNVAVSSRSSGAECGTTKSSDDSQAGAFKSEGPTNEEEVDTSALDKQWCDIAKFIVGVNGCIVVDISIDTLQKYNACRLFKSYYDQKTANIDAEEGTLRGNGYSDVTVAKKLMKKRQKLVMELKDKYLKSLETFETIKVEDLFKPQISDDIITEFKLRFIRAELQTALKALKSTGSVGAFKMIELDGTKIYHYQTQEEKMLLEKLTGSDRKHAHFHNELEYLRWKILRKMMEDIVDVNNAQTVTILKQICQDEKKAFRRTTNGKKQMDFIDSIIPAAKFVSQLDIVTM